MIVIIELSALIILFIINIMLTKKVNKPSSYLILPFISIVIIFLLFSPGTEYNEIDPLLILVWLIAYVPFFFVDLFNNNYANRRRIKERIKSGESNKPLYLLLFLFSVSFLFRAFSIIGSNDYIYYISTNYFALELASGLYEYLRSLLMTLVIVCIGNTRFRLLEIVSITLGILILTLFQIKGMLLMPIVAGCLYYISKNKIKIKFNIILFSIVLGFLSFFIVYSVPYLYNLEFSYVFSLNYISFVLSKVFTFLFSGILGFDSSIIYNNIDIGIKTILAPLSNILRHLTGWERVILQRAPITISIDGTSSNVGTLFGTVYMFTNIGFTLIYSFMLALLSKLLLFLSQMYNNRWIQTMYYNLLAIFIFSWFEFYFWHQYIITMFLWCFLSILIDYIIRKVKISYRRIT